MNNKKIFCKFSVVFGLLCNSGIKSAQSAQLVVSKSSLKGKYRYIQPEGVEWLEQDNHPLGLLINSFRKYMEMPGSPIDKAVVRVSFEFAEKEQKFIKKNWQYLNVLSCSSGVAHNIQYLSLIHIGLDVPPITEGNGNGKRLKEFLQYNIEFLLKQGASPNSYTYKIIYKRMDNTVFLTGNEIQQPGYLSDQHVEICPLLFQLTSLFKLEKIIGETIMEAIHLVLKYGADSNKGETITTSDGNITHYSPLFPILHLFLNGNQEENLKRSIALLIAYGANIKQVKEEYIKNNPAQSETIIEKFQKGFANQEFKQYLKEEKKRRFAYELSKQVGVVPGTVSTHRMLQMRKLGSRPGFRVPGFKY